jgi:hypothetical protein
LDLATDAFCLSFKMKIRSSIVNSHTSGWSHSYAETSTTVFPDCRLSHKLNPPARSHRRRLYATPRQFLVIELLRRISKDFIEKCKASTNSLAWSAAPNA